MYQTSTHFFSQWRRMRHIFLILYVATTIMVGYLPSAHADSSASTKNTYGSKGLTGIDKRVACGSDDAEEQIGNGVVSIASDDLEMVKNHNKGNQIIGIRFNRLKIPNQAHIKSAYLKFTAKKKSTQSTTLNITMDASDHASTFKPNRRNISSRKQLPVSVKWAKVAPWWHTGSSHRSPDLSALVQRIVNRDGWRSGNAMAFIIRGNGHRSAYAFESGAGRAPLLHVEYTTTKPPHHTIQASAVGPGTINPEGDITVSHGKSKTFTITPNPHHQISDVLVDGKSVGPVESYQFKRVVSNHTIVAKFKSKKYTIKATTGDHGIISPSGKQVVKSGENVTYTMTPEPGFYIKDILVDGKSVGAVKTYTFTNIQANHKIHAKFAIMQYTLTAKAGENGSIDPSGKIIVDHGQRQTFTIKADEHYEISGVKVDDKYKGAINSYTFENVTRNHTIIASFVVKKYQVMVKTPVNGTVTPAGTQIASFGERLTYTFIPEDGYILSDIILDNRSVGAHSSYTLTVSSDHMIEAVFVKENQAPIADAGPDQRVAEGAEVVLTGLNSIDVDDGIASFLWEQIDGPQVQLSDHLGESTTFTAPAGGDHGVALVFRLTVTDYAGITAEDTTIVNISEINMPPFAVTGPDQTVTSGVKVLLDGSSSSDPDDGILEFNWVQKSGIPVKLLNQDSSIAHFIAPEFGSDDSALVFELTVTDQGGLKASATGIVNLSHLDTLLVAEAGPNQNVWEGDEVTLNGANSLATNAGIVNYTWTQTGGVPVILSDSSAISPTFVAPHAGVAGVPIAFKLTITNSIGLKAQDSCIVNVIGKNLPPVAHAGNDMTVSAASRVVLDGSLSEDQDGGIAHYQWCQISGPQVRLSGAGTAISEFTAPEVDSGDLSLAFRLTVTDTDGLQSVDIVIVNVSRENLPPLADAGMDLNTRSGLQVVLNGSWSSDPDDGIASYHWIQVSGPPVLLINPNEMVPFFTAPDVNQNGIVLVFSLIVTDLGGLKNSDRCEIIVDMGSNNDTMPPEILITEPVDSGFYETEEKSVTLSGNAWDTNGIATVTWTNSNGESGVASGTEAWSISSISLSPGKNVITVIAEDIAGNSARAQLIVTSEKKPDTKPPVLVITYPNTTGFFDTQLAYVDIRGTSRDDNELDKITWKNSNGDGGEAIGTGNWEILRVKLDEWFNVISVTATDMAGNSTTEEITILRWPFSIF